MSNSHSIPYIVGVTSTLGAGKTTFLGIVQQRGFKTFNMDVLTHELLSGPNPAYDKVLARFGQDLVSAPGAAIDRLKLAAVVFTDVKARRELEAILHPAVRQLCRDRIAQLVDEKLVFVEVPLLFESNMQGEYDETLALTVDEGVQMERLLQRPNMTPDRARQRIEAQLPGKRKAELADVAIDNSGTLPEFEVKIDQYLSALATRVQAKAASAAVVEQPVVAPAAVVDEVDGDAADEDTGPAAGTTSPAATIDGSPAASTPIGSGAGTGTTADSAAAASTTVAQDDPDAEQRNQERRELLRQFGHIGTDQALSRIGDVGSTQHKEASASVSLDVASHDDGHTPPDAETQLQVDVRMSVRTKPGGPTDGCGCSCGCGKTCHAGCACAADCGCNCPPKPPTPPVPPVPPQPPKKKRRCGKIVGVVAIVAMVLAFLAALAYMSDDHHHKGGGGDDGGTTVIINPPCGSCTTPPTQPPVDPPKPPPTTGGCKTGAVEHFSDVPAFAMQYTHNWVRYRVNDWTVEYGGCSAVSVTGRDGSGRLVVYQVYDNGFAFRYQWTVSYGNDTVQIDRFEAYNTFIGRTVYTYSSGRIVRAARMDGHQRLMIDCFIAYDGSVSLKEYDPSSGRYLGTENFGPSQAPSTMASNFYLYSTFSR